ncbi:unnamed protein product [Owenia fusiformis]|uniref:Uncharacterized protein n=1 Tax=Owenia fusiformis TaxID=6347 RepID=A0A8J1U2M2_OWEFU|nr:unnamed protein product [Owenia fusiformis]
MATDALPEETVNLAATSRMIGVNYTNGTILDDGPGPSRLATAVGAVIILIFLVEGILGNLWIMFVILRKKEMRNVINIFIVSLCVNDLMNLCVNQILFLSSYIALEWVTGMAVCGVVPELSVVFTGTSLWHSALIAIHRYIVVIHNDVYNRMHIKLYVGFVLVITRVLPFAFNIPAIITPMAGYSPKLLRCILLPQYATRTMAMMVCLFIVPCLIVICCFLAIFIYVHRSTLRIQNAGFRREIQITKMFGCVFFTILIGYLPYAFIRTGDRNNQLSPDVYVIVSTLYSVATCLSPLIYGAMNQQIRQACQDCSTCSNYDKKRRHSDRYLGEQTVRLTNGTKASIGDKSSSTDHADQLKVNCSDREMTSSYADENCLVHSNKSNGKGPTFV